MSKIPAFQFYPADWRKDPSVQALSFHDKGVWFEILCLMHESCERGKLLLKEGIPMPEDALSRLLGLDKQNLTKTLTTLIEYGVCSRCEDTGALISRRMVKDDRVRKIRAESGKKGGNPNLLKQKDNQDGNQTGKQKATPSSSSSSSSSSSTTVNTPIVPQGGKRSRFKKPTFEEWSTYAKTLNPPLPEDSQQRTYDHYESNGWKIGGKATMKDWKAALRNCHGRWVKEGGGKKGNFGL